MHMNEPFKWLLQTYSLFQNAEKWATLPKCSKLPIHTEGMKATKMLEYVKKTVFPKMIKIWEI